MTQDQADYITDALEMMGIVEPKQIVTEVSGFIPVFEVVLHHYKDYMTALVFGRMWQYCGMSDGVCRASLERIGKDIEVSAVTVMRHAEKLVNDGYLIDTTPDKRNAPHVYMDGRKVEMKSRITAGMTINNATVIKSNTSVINSQLIKQDNTKIKQKNIKHSAEKPAKPATPPEVKLFREVTSRYPNKVNFENVTNIINGVSKRLGRDCSADDLRPFYAAWCAKGFKPVNLAWLSWAETGIIPEMRQAQNKNSGADALMQYAQNIGAV